MSDGGGIQFSAEDLVLFSTASHDRNPLHLDAAYARKTPYGERVVFGVLGALACLANVEVPPEHRIAELQVTFEAPMFLHEDYRVQVAQSANERLKATLYDGDRALVRLKVTFELGAERAMPRLEHEHATRREAHRLRPVDMATCPGVEGVWSANGDALCRLADRLLLPTSVRDSPAVNGLLWASYMVGMELPGERALFASLVLRTPSSGSSVAGTFTYDADVTSFDARFSIADLRCHLRMGTQVLAVATIRTFVREELSEAGHAEAAEPSSRLGGRVALVVGASRGLGASIARGLAWQGCIVLACYLHSQLEADALVEITRAAPGRIELVRGDATDSAWLTALEQRVSTQFGGLDILVCNAAPVPKPTAFHVGSLKRISEYIEASLSMVNAPLATFVDVLSRRRGSVVIISSEYVTKIPKEWPQYVAAKWAIEGLVRAVAAERPKVAFVIVRPPRLETDMSNAASPLYRMGALPPSEVTRVLLGELGAEHPSDGNVTLLEDFSQKSRGSSFSSA